MILPKKILFSYFGLALIATIAFIFNYNLIMNITRTPLVLLIFLYYYFSAKKINYVFVTFLFITFLSDLWMLFFDNFLILITLVLASYVLFLVLGIKDFVKFKPTTINITSLGIVFLFITFLFITILDLVVTQKQDYKIPFTIYGLILSSCALVGAYNLIFRNRKYDFFYFLTVSTFVITDVFYAVNKFYYKVEIFVFLNFIIQITSYFFMVKFMLEKQKYNSN